MNCVISQSVLTVVCGVGAVYHSCLLSLAWYLQVVIRTSTSSATGYYLVPYHDRHEATFTMEAKEVIL